VSGGATEHDDDSEVPSDAPPSEAWERFVLRGDVAIRLSDRLFGWIPGSPRCKLCHNPFGGPAGKAFALIGCKPSRLNPSFCTRCVEKLPLGGANVDVAVLFADIRGSTALGEQARPEDFAELLQRFYTLSTRVLVAHDAIIDKVIGDEVMALFVRGFAGSHYRRAAAEAAVDLVRTLSREGDLPVGAAAHAGSAFVGSIGSEHFVDFTAVGDTVNTTARLQGQASAGQVVLGEELYREIAASHPTAAASRVEIRGRAAPVDIRILDVCR
jgi:adenylate cyclase